MIKFRMVISQRLKLLVLLQFYKGSDSWISFSSFNKPNLPSASRIHFLSSYIEKFELVFSLINRRIVSFSARPLCGLALCIFCKDRRQVREIFIIIVRLWRTEIQKQFNVFFAHPLPRSLP